MKKVLDSDDGARRLGEVALVPNSSPISSSGLLFYNTLFDENAACHIALGQCYSKCFKGEKNLSTSEIKDRGGNSSMIHIDWMIGLGEIDIDGFGNDGCGGVFWICAVRNDDSLGKSIEQHVRVWDFYRVDVYFVCSVGVLF